jgi:hypothetical protein
VGGVGGVGRSESGSHALFILRFTSPWQSVQSLETIEFLTLEEIKMKCNRLKSSARSLFLAACIAWVFPVSAQDFSIKSGESIDLLSVYWVRNCQSLLKSVLGVDVLEGPPGITLSLREESVKTSARQNCLNNVPGAIVVATAKQGLARSVETLKYRVRYDTEEGQKQSNHSSRVFVYPP